MIGRPTLNRVNAPSAAASGDPASGDPAAEALEARRARYLVLLTVVGLLGEAAGSYLVLLSGYCPKGHSCLVQEAVGTVFVGAGFLAVIGVGVLGSLLLALALSFLGVGAGALAGGTQGGGWVGLVIGGEFVAMGLLLLGVQQWQARRRRRIVREETTLWRVGRPGRAAVLDVDDAGRRAGRMRIVTLTLRIDPGDGGGLYTVDVDHRVRPGSIPRPGDLHDVRLDPQDRTRLVVGPRLGAAAAGSASSPGGG
jgi:hypothetical protein